MEREPLIVREDVTSIIGGLLEMNARLGEIRDDVAAIRALLEGEDGEEEDD